MRVGFIGIGTMGVGISANMRKAGFDMVVHDARRQAAEKICAAGATWADRKSTRLNSSHSQQSRMPSSA